MDVKVNSGFAKIWTILQILNNFSHVGEQILCRVIGKYNQSSGKVNISHVNVGVYDNDFSRSYYSCHQMKSESALKSVKLNTEILCMDKEI